MELCPHQSDRLIVSSRLLQLQSVNISIAQSVSQAIIQLAGNLSNQPAIPLSTFAEIADFAAVNLVFA